VLTLLRLSLQHERYMKVDDPEIGISWPLIDGVILSENYGGSGEVASGMLDPYIV